MSRTRKDGAPTQVSNETRERWRKERAARALAAALGRPSVMPAPSTDIQDQLAKARIAIEQGGYPEAIRLLRNILATVPGHPEAKNLWEEAYAANTSKLAGEYLRKGIVDLRKGQHSNARRYFEKALEVDGENLEAKYRLATVLLQQKKNLSLALKLAKETVEKGESRAHYWANLGEIHIWANHYRESWSAFQKACLLSPSNREYRKRLQEIQRNGPP